MVSQKTYAVILFVLLCSAFSSVCLGLQQIDISINSWGTIGTPSSVHGYICGNYNSTHYYAQNNITGNYELISTNAAQTISYALSKLTPGRTWQEAIILKGSFSIYSTVTVSGSNTLLDFSQATVNIFAVVPAFDIRGSSNTFYGGLYNPFTGQGTHSVWNGQGTTSSAIWAWGTKDTVDGFEFTGFRNSQVLAAADGGTTVREMTIQNCYFHDNPGATNILLNNERSGYNSVLGCKFGISFSGIVVAGGVIQNVVDGCEFYGWHSSGGHAIYFGGGNAANSGYNTVSNNYFHDGVNGAGCHIKCHYNSIHDNVFENMTLSTAVPFSIYSEMPGYLANDNDIYNNSITNCYYGFFIGHDTSGNNPTLRNLIHDNHFTKVTNCFRILATSNTVEDTKIYYNDFTNCPTVFQTTGATASWIKNTVIAYNYIDNASVPNVSWVQSWANSMSYQNTRSATDTSLAMPNFNYNAVTDPASWYYVAPRA